MSFVGTGLPDDLETIVSARFDELVGKGEVFYKPPKIEIEDMDGFQVPFFEKFREPLLNHREFSNQPECSLL